MHSTASDGTLAPEDVVAAAAVAALHAIALTDHDTLHGLGAARAAGDRLGVRVVAGVELSASENGREVHLLGLHLGRTDKLEQRLAVFRETRRARAAEIVALLNALGVPLDLASVLDLAGAGAGAVVGRPHVARAMTAHGWARDERDAFDRYLGHGRPAFVAKHHLPMGEAIALIHEAGGLAILAHPGPTGMRNRLEALAALGLDGVEVLHPGHNRQDTARIGMLADDLHLVPSGGSDWHGAIDGPRTIGCMNVPAVWLDRQDQRVARRSAREWVA